MAGICKVVGSALAVIGVAVALTFAVLIARDQEYRQTALAYSRNLGNVMYEAQYKGAQARRAFELVGAIVGVLLALNGVTLVGLGIVATRVTER